MVNPSFFPKEGKNRKSTGVIQNSGSGSAVHSQAQHMPPVLFIAGGNTHPVT